MRHSKGSGVSSARGLGVGGGGGDGDRRRLHPCPAPLSPSSTPPRPSTHSLRRVRVRRPRARREGGSPPRTCAQGRARPRTSTFLHPTRWDTTAIWMSSLIPFARDLGSGRSHHVDGGPGVGPRCRPRTRLSTGPHAGARPVRLSTRRWGRGCPSAARRGLASRGRRGKRFSRGWRRSRLVRPRLRQRDPRGFSFASVKVGTGSSQTLTRELCSCQEGQV